MPERPRSRMLPVGFAALVGSLAVGCGGDSSDGDEPADPSRCGAPKNLDDLPAPAFVYAQSSPNIDYFSPRAFDLDGDGDLEIVASGGSEAPRHGELVALDGRSGDVLWRFMDPRGPLPEYYFYNFYTAVPLDDLTDDGISDLLLSNGGSDAIMEPGAPRPPGHLIVLDAKTGELLAWAHTSA